IVKLAKASKNQGDPKKMAPPPKEVEEDSEDEEMSEDEDDDSSEEEVIIPQKKGKRATATSAKKVVVAVATPSKKAAVTPGKKAAATPAKKMVTSANAVVTPGKKGATQGSLVATPGKEGAATPAKGAKDGKNAKTEDSDDEEDDSKEDDEDDDEEEEEFERAVIKAAAAAPASQDKDYEDDEDEEDEDDDDDEEDDSEEGSMETTPAKGKKTAKAVPVKAKKEEDEDEDDDEEEEEEEEPVKEAPGKRKKEMTKQKAAPEAKKQKVGVTYIAHAPLPPRVRVSSVSIPQTLIGMTRKFGYVDFESAEDLEKALELGGLKVFGNDIKLEKPKGKDNKKDRDARTLLAKNLPYKVTQDELKEVFEDALEIRLVSKDAKSKGIAYIEFKTEADAEKTFEEKQGTEIDGRSISLYYTGEKGQSQDYRSGKNSKWSGESKTLVLAGLQQKKLQEVFEKAALIKVPQNQNGKSKGYAFIESASFEDAKEALNSRNKREIEGRAIRLALQAPRGSPNAGSQGLSEGTTEETLRESLDGSVHAGTVTDRETGSAKGFGFVDFNSEEDAKTAKEAMEDDEMDGNKVTLEWDKRKGEAGFGGRGGGRGGQGGFGGRGRGGFGGHGGFRGGGGGDHEPQGKKTKSE
uniref:Nucleolin n=1 Tax=Microcebus murinus TaxID=30608 RepID=A0A8C5VNR9_MICMU